MKHKEQNISNIDEITLKGNAMASLLGCTLAYVGTLVKDGKIDKVGKAQYSLTSVTEYITSLKQGKTKQPKVKEEIDKEKLEGLKLENAKRRMEIQNTITAIRDEERQSYRSLIYAYLSDMRTALLALPKAHRNKLHVALKTSIDNAKQFINGNDEDVIQISNKATKKRKTK